jgi:hypothetical protein
MEEMVKILIGDDEIVYEDNNQMFGGSYISLKELKEYWNNNFKSDYCLQNYSDFDSWFSDTKMWLD